MSPDGEPTPTAHRTMDQPRPAEMVTRDVDLATPIAGWFITAAILIPVIALVVAIARRYRIIRRQTWS